MQRSLPLKSRLSIRKQRNDRAVPIERHHTGPAFRLQVIKDFGCHPSSIYLRPRINEHQSSGYYCMKWLRGVVGRHPFRKRECTGSSSFRCKSSDGSKTLLQQRKTFWSIWAVYLPPTVIFLWCKNVRKKDGISFQIQVFRAGAPSRLGWCHFSNSREKFTD